MILAVDVDYKGNTAQCAGVAFDHWADEDHSNIYTTVIDSVDQYESGQFYKRELPCITQLLSEHKLRPEIIIVDGYVYLNGRDLPGLGKHLYDHYNGEIAIIGVAKSAYKDIPVNHRLLRGDSKMPLYITSEGVDLAFAKERIGAMHGEFRIPKLLKLADQMCRNWEVPE